MMKSYIQFILILILVGCSPNSKLAIASATVPSPISTPTIAQTANLPIVPTITLISTAISSHPISTPSTKESSAITLELLRTNNGCELPCWWGIIPNQTNWNDAQKFLKPFSTIYERQPPSEWFVYDVNSPLTIEFSEVYAVRTVYAAQEGTVKEIETGYFDEKTFHLPSLLLKYGAPSQVFISTYSSDSGLSPNQVPMSIDLYYPEKGINALYGTYATVKGDKIIGCISKSPTLFLWSPDEHNRSIDYILGWDKHKTPYMNIEKATDLDIQEFYEKYANLESLPCFQTSTGLWSAQ